MKIHDLEVTGSLIYNGVNLLSLTSSVTDSGSFSAQIVNLNQVSSSLNSFTSSINTTIKNKLDSESVISGSAQVLITGTTGYSTFSSSISNSVSSLSSSVGSLSSSIATTTSNLSSSIGGLSSSVATTTGNLSSRIGSVETKTGSYATTGSNIFVGSQVITGSLYITNDMVVQGCSCLQNITASAVSIGTNTVVLNTATPAVRFAGISVQDSGSNAGVTGSIYWDGLCNRWVYSNPSGIGYSGGMLLSGPRTSTLGSESPLTCNYIAKSGGGDHLYDSCIIDDGTTVCINANLKGSGTISGTNIYGSTAVCSAVGKFTTCIDAGSGTFGSSVRSNSHFIVSDGSTANVVLQGYINNALRIAESGSASSGGARGNLYVGALDVGGASVFSGDLCVSTAGSTSVLFDGTNPTLTLRRNNNGNASAAINFKGSSAVKWQMGTNQATGLGFEINEGDATANRFYIAPGGAATFSSTINSGTITATSLASNGQVSLYDYVNVQNNYPNFTQLSGIRGRAYYQTNYPTSILMGDPGASNTNIITFNASDGDVTGTEKMRITGGGNVGVGTQTPCGKIQVSLSTVSGGCFRNASGGEAALTIEASGNSYMQFMNNSSSQTGIMFGNNCLQYSGMIWYRHNSKQLMLGAGGTETMYVCGGNVGIGMSTPSQKLHVVGGFLQTYDNSSWYRNVFERNVTSWDNVVGFSPQSSPQYTYGYINITASAYNNGTSAGGVVTSRWYYSITNNSISVSVVGSDIVTGSQAPMVRLLVTSGTIYVQVQSTNGSTAAYTTVFVDAMLASGYINGTYWLIS